MSNFFSFDSSYRYEPVMRPFDPKVIDREMEAFRAMLLRDPKFKKEKVFAIALESGFASQAPFNRAFKAHFKFFSRR